jgi:uncharacterized protein YhfF
MSTIAEPFRDFWAHAQRGVPALDTERFYEAFAFGDSEALATELADLVLRGIKRATASLVWTYDVEHKPRPRPGDFSIVTSWDQRPLCIIETTAVDVVPFHAVGEAFAHAEGEGDRSLAHWRRAHAAFFQRECARIQRDPAPDMPVLCEHFRVVFPTGDETVR